MKVILLAYACHPQQGSEQSFGWGWLKELAKDHEIWAFYYAGQGQAEAVDKAVRELPYKKNVHLCPRGVNKNLHLNILFRIRHEVWQRKVLAEIGQLVVKEKIEIIHQVTIGSWFTTDNFAKFHVPFILGPIAG
jgi:hypothetical protein